MPGKRKSPEARKNQIMAAADLVLLEVGIEAFTVDQVIRKAKMAKGTLYNYYKNKDEMLAELGVKALALLLSYFEHETDKETGSMGKVKALVRACYAYYSKYPEYFELISYMDRPEFDINTGDYLKLSQKLQHFTRKMIEEGQERGEIKASLDANMVHYILWASCVGVVEFVESKKRLLKNHHEIDTEQMVETFALIMTEGLAV